MIEVKQLDAGQGHSVHVIFKDDCNCGPADMLHIELYERIKELEEKLDESGDRIKQLTLDYQEGLGQK